jgi:hypothetical protein
MGCSMHRFLKSVPFGLGGIFQPYQGYTIIFSKFISLLLRFKALSEHNSIISK